MTAEERNRGILTEADRKYLRDPDQYSRQASHERQKYIHERVKNALLDFTLLKECSSGVHFDSILTPDSGESGIYGPGRDPHRPHRRISEQELDADVYQGLVDMIVFVDRACAYADMNLEYVFEEGVRDALAGRNDDLIVNDVTIEVDTDLRPAAANAGLRKLKRGDVPNSGEIRALLESDQVSDERIEQLRELLRQQSN